MKMVTQSILCVDPDHEAQALLREILCHYEPVFASNANDAWRMVNSRFFDAYLLESWLRSYRPQELFDDVGAPAPDLIEFCPTGPLRLGCCPAGHGGTSRR